MRLFLLPSLPRQGGRIWAFSEKGYFSEADPNADLRSSKKRREYDVSKRKGMSDFIWNTDWQSQLEREAQKKREEEERKAKAKEKPSGFLSLSRAAALDSLTVDLSETLKRKSDSPTASDSGSPASSAYIPPTQASLLRKGQNETAVQKEVVDWARSAKFATRVVPPDPDAEKQRTAEQSIAAYRRENSETLLWNTALTGICFATCYSFYTQDVAFSYVAGAVGGVLYLRLLKRSVEGIAGDGGLSSLAGQPRLLIPVVLVMAFNRWNALAAEDVGIRLEILPMLVGFFTYKAGVVGRQSLSLVQDVLREMKGGPRQK